jgi:hypothetical protein
MPPRKASDRPEKAPKPEEQGAAPASPQEPPTKEARPEVLDQIHAYLQAIRREAEAAEPVAGKLTSKQIDKVLSQIAAKTAQESRDGRLRLWLAAAAGAGALIAFCFLWAYSLSYGDTTLMHELIKMIGSVVGGLLGGYGIGRMAKRKRK